MYEFTHTKTGRVYRRKTLAACRKLIDKLECEYGACCTTYPKFVEEVK